MRSNSTLAGLRPSLPVKTLPLSVRICSGIPCLLSASSSASHSGRAVARATTLAMTQKREWSSIPVTTETAIPVASLMFPRMSSCHSSIERDLSQRL
jgi:hypothetical protein